MSLILAASQRSLQTAFKFAVERVVVSEAEASGLAPGPYALLVIHCARVPTPTIGKSRLPPAGDQLAALLPPLADLLRTMLGKLEVIVGAEDEARFEFYLPVSVAAVSRSSSQRLAPRSPGAHTVCVIENEPAIAIHAASAG